jgi:isochorismate pyruvate lyase
MKDPGLTCVAGPPADGILALESLRASIREVDIRLLELVSRRTSLCLQAGREKRRIGLALRDREVERRVIENARRHAVLRRLDPELASSMFRLLIDYSVHCQQKAHLDSGL